MKKGERTDENLQMDLWKAAEEGNLDVFARDGGGETAGSRAVKAGKAEMLPHLLCVHAARTGHKEVAAFLKEHGKGLLRGSEETTPLAKAAEEGRYDIVTYVIGALPHLLEKGEQGTIVSFCAGKGGDREVVRYLLEQGADPVHCLCGAASGGHLGIVQAMVALGADVNGRYPADLDEVPPLYFSASFGHLLVTKYLVEQGADVNARSLEGFYALNEAARGGHLGVVRYLVNQGANLTDTRWERCIPLESAARNGHQEVVRYFLELGADIIDGLRGAACGGHLELVASLLAQGANINGHSGRNGFSPLPCAAFEGQWKSVRFLVEHGADVNARGYDEMTALMFAAREGPLELVRFLVENGADIDAEDECGQTALMLAILYGRQKAVRFLERLS